MSFVYQNTPICRCSRVLDVPIIAVLLVIGVGGALCCECCTEQYMQVQSSVNSRWKSLYSIVTCCGLQADGLQADCSCVRGFVLLLTLYVYSSSAGTFHPIPSMPSGVPVQLLNATKALQALDQGETGFLGNVSEQRLSALKEYMPLCTVIMLGSKGVAKQHHRLHKHG